MSTTILDDKELTKIDREIEKNGILIHTIEATKDSKGAWSEIYKLNEDFYNVVYSDRQDAWMVLIEKLDNKEELVKYDSSIDLNLV